jgi:hypothetical protein
MYSTASFKGTDRAFAWSLVDCLSRDRSEAATSNRKFKNRQHETFHAFSCRISFFNAVEMHPRASPAFFGIAPMTGKLRLVVVVPWLPVAAIVGLGFALLLGSYYVNNSSFREMEGRWRIAQIKNLNPSYLRYYLWENLVFNIDRSGLLGNKGTPFAMLISSDWCGGNCYYVYDIFATRLANIPEPKYRLVRSGSDSLSIYPSSGSEIILERLKD